MDLRIISIGCLDAHPLWNEKGPARTGHATTTLIRTDGKAILVDPGLPPAIITARLAERSGLEAQDITHVFLTSFRPETIRGLEAFPEVPWLVSETERETVGVPLAQMLQQALAEDEKNLAEALSADVARLRRCESAPDRLAKGVDLFPLPGVTPGLCGLLVAEAMRTILICGDAAPTIEHIERGMVMKNAANLEKAKESLIEAMEIADLLVPGRDNIVPSPSQRPF